MGIEQELESIYIMRKRLESRQKHYERYLDTFAPQSALSGRPQVQGGVSASEVRLGHLAKLGKEVSKLEWIYFSKLQWFYGVLDRLNEPLWEEILMLRYVNGKNLKDLSKDIKYSESHIRRCFRQAKCEFIRLAETISKDDRK